MRARRCRCLATGALPMRDRGMQRQTLSTSMARMRRSTPVTVSSAGSQEMPGDYAQLALLAKQFRRLASDAGRRSLANAPAEEAVTLAQLGFRESRDPYGKPWAPLKLRVGGKPLLDRGRLRSSITKSDVTASGFRLGSNLIYARVHQYG